MTNQIPQLVLDAVSRTLTSDPCNDRKWFNENPESESRIRPCTKDELAGAGESNGKGLDTHVLKLVNGTLVRIVAESMNETET